LARISWRECAGSGAALEDDMMTDAALWLIFGVAIALIAYGCQCTRPAPKAAAQPFEREIDGVA
jgi:hypothetical protein